MYVSSFHTYLTIEIGSHLSRLKCSICMKRNVMSILVLVIYTFALAYIFTSTVFFVGSGLSSYRLCVAMVWVCNLMYAFVNFAIVAFLFERIHVIHAPFVRRLEDRIYLAYLATIFVSLTPVAIENYINTKASTSSDGRCYFGVKGNTTIYALAINTFIHLALTGVFFCMFRPSINIHRLPTTLRAPQNMRGGNNPLVEDEKKRTPFQRNI
jgi:hypothetical protein